MLPENTRTFYIDNVVEHCYADYYSSIRAASEPYVAFKSIAAKSVAEVVALTSEHAINLNLDLLWNACPFLP